jgi:hypothetical protein
MNRPSTQLTNAQWDIIAVFWAQRVKSNEIVQAIGGVIKIPAFDNSNERGERHGTYETPFAKKVDFCYN